MECFFFHMSLCIIDAATPEALKHSINDTAIVRWKGWDTGRVGTLESLDICSQSFSTTKSLLDSITVSSVSDCQVVTR